MGYNQENHSRSKILLVDDNLEYLDAIQMLLKREGHLITTAPSGIEALNIVKSQSFDLVLVDYCMPSMTGEEFVRELRTFDDIVQVILQTGYASEQPPHELLRRLDIQGYFDKSEGPEKLLLWVEVGIKASKSTQITRENMKGLDQNPPETDYIENADKKGKIYPVINLPVEEIDKIINKINELMENDKIYMDIGITLPDLSKKIGVKRNQLSFLLNKYFNTNFYDFINKYRVNEAKKILAQNTNTRVNLLNVGMVVGFNSKTAFNVNFKKLAHMSPSEYRKAYKCNTKHVM
jgi:YesN/AraC family two-component response regulator